MLNGILLDARRCNTRDDITGALVCRHDIYLQLLEGPDDKVQATYERIRQDDRHVNPVELLSRPVQGRTFGKWAMLHDPATSWLWSSDEIADGILDRVAPSEIASLFEKLAETAKDLPPDR